MRNFFEEYCETYLIGTSLGPGKNEIFIAR